MGCVKEVTSFQRAPEIQPKGAAPVVLRLTISFLRCKWSADADKASLVALQKILDEAAVSEPALFDLRLLWLPCLGSYPL